MLLIALILLARAAGVSAEHESFMADDGDVLRRGQVERDREGRRRAPNVASLPPYVALETTTLRAPTSISFSIGGGGDGKFTSTEQARAEAAIRALQVRQQVREQAEAAADAMEFVRGAAKVGAKAFDFFSGAAVTLLDELRWMSDQDGRIFGTTFAETGPAPGDVASQASSTTPLTPPSPPPPPSPPLLYDFASSGPRWGTLLHL
jgi:hypothetical protein